MCTAIAERAPMEGSAKGQHGWFDMSHLYVAYDHPFHLRSEHALCLSFACEQDGATARVAVELPRDAARELAQRILTAVDRADAHEQAATD